MKVSPTNKMFNGLTVQVFDPDTGVAFPSDAIIDLTLYPFEKQQYFMHIVLDGDLAEVSQTPLKQGAVKDGSNIV